jgi:tetratricopeptide (TPR) repeat protein
MTVPALLLSISHGVAGDFGQTMRQFSAARHALATNLSSRLSLPLPPEAKAFFRVATTGQWEAVSNTFERVKQHAAYGTANPTLRNELWAPIHETIGIWEVWVGWENNSSLLAMFHEPVMSSMPKGSIYFGGTDYGRFVITTVNALREPPPLYCITQNALADNTYAAHLRAVYGDSIWLPQMQDSACAFQRYVEEVKSGDRPKNAELEIVNGRVKVSGALGVMEINGILCEMIFEHNKATHEFYVEESYAIDWMYPYLEPHGLIMKLNSQPLEELPAETVARDQDYWAEYEKRLRTHPSFEGNFEAEKGFSKLRSAIAGLYAHREMYEEAELAFEQAIRLCPVSPEASFRLAKMYVQNGRTADAIRIMDAYVKSDPPYSSEKAVHYLEELKAKEVQNSSVEDIGANRAKSSR